METLPAPALPKNLPWLYHFTTQLFTQLPMFPSRSERRKKKRNMEKKSFGSFYRTPKRLFCVSPSSAILGEIYVTKRGRGSGASNQGFLFFSSVFFVSPFHQRSFTFWPEEKKRWIFSFIVIFCYKLSGVGEDHSAGFLLR
jgi:hypothetical protein